MKVYRRNVCSSTLSSSALYGVEWSKHDPIYTRDCEDVLGKFLSSLSAFERPIVLLVAMSLHRPLYPSYSTFVYRTNRLSVTHRARQVPDPVRAVVRVMFALSQLPRNLYSLRLFTCQLTKTPAEPYIDGEASLTHFLSIRHQFAPSARPFTSYRLDPVIFVSISVRFLSLFHRKPSV
jgi:hypothetical protein